MGRVRKDILNGWKEIGAYVCRDIRTVERWEKHRGPPVRRVPGAGRATVYALISEVDEWLVSAKIDETDDPAGVETPAPPIVKETVAAPGEDAASESTIDLLEQTPPSPPLASSYPSRFSLRSIAVGLGVAAVIAVLFAAVWPRMVQARRGGPTHTEVSYDSDTSRTPPSIPYRSKVNGVDDLYLSGLYSYEQRTPAALQQARSNTSTPPSPRTPITPLATRAWPTPTTCCASTPGCRRPRLIARRKLLPSRRYGSIRSCPRLTPRYSS